MKDPYQILGVPKNATQADIKKAYLNGVISYFTKPYDFKKLLQEINKIIAAKERTL